MVLGKISKSSRVFVWIIMGMIVVGLFGFGATGLSGSVRSIGSVGDTEIELNRYARELDQELRALQAQTGQSLSFSEARAFGLDQVVLQRLVSTAALENETARIGISVGDEEVRRQVLATPAFGGIDGNFDRDAYEFTLDRSGTTPARFETSVRAELALTILQGAVSSGITAPSGFADTLIGYIGERRNFSWIQLDRTTLEEPLGEPSDADLRGHYDANIADFTLPEAKALTYAWLSPETLLEQIEIDEQALRDLYQDRIADFVVPERRLVERLIFASTDEAATAMAEIDSGSKSFADIVAERGLELSDIDLGDVTADDLGDAAAAVFGLTLPGLAGPVETDLGPAIIRVNAILGAQETTFEEARAELRDEFAADRARRNISDQINNIDDLLAGGATLEDLADETDMQLGSLNWTQGASDGIAAYEAFAQAAASVAAEDFPAVIELDDGGIFALRQDGLVPARPEPYDSVVIRVIEAWELAEIDARLTDQAAVMKAELDNGARISSIGQPVTVETHVTRDGFIAGTTPEFLSEVFQMAVGDNQVVRGAGSVLIAQLSDILPPDPTDPDGAAIRSQIQGQVAQGISQDVLDSFTRAMLARAGISLNQSAINAVHAQFP